MSEKQPERAVGPAHTGPETEQLQEPARVEAGSWWWLKLDDEWELACAVGLGSNYVELETPAGHSERVHHRDWFESTKPAPDYREAISLRVVREQGEVRRLLEEVQATMRRLGVSPRLGITQLQESANETRAVATEVRSADDYVGALEVANREELPELFREIKLASERLATWLKAEVLPLEARVKEEGGVIKLVEGRIFNVKLYAGLSEKVEKVSDGEPAGFDEKLRVMQRMCYMDEESLLGYEHGGMDIRAIEDFDRWVVKPRNRDRLLPFPRTIAAFRVRRHEKERRSRDLMQAWINAQLAEGDKLTYLYVRNGERVYRVATELEFGERLFPSQGELEQAEPMVALVDSAGRVEFFKTAREHQADLDEEAAREARSAAWREANPFDEWLQKRVAEHPSHANMPRGFLEDDWERSDPHRRRHGRLSSDTWEPFDSSSVYHDDMLAKVRAETERWNRTALIIQGLFDRSDALHPHPPVSTWDAASFARSVELVYDGQRNLYAGDKPDFEAYRRAGLAALKHGDVTVGQQRPWLEREREAERARREGYESQRSVDYWRPDNDPGPGHVARVERLVMTRGEAVFRWKRGKRNVYRSPRTIDASIAVPLTELFNVSAYRPGDYRRFFEDPRTRSEYLEWANVMLTAEEYHAGNIKIVDGRCEVRRRAARARPGESKCEHCGAPVGSAGSLQGVGDNKWRCVDEAACARRIELNVADKISEE